MGDVLHFDFARRVKIGADEWSAGAARCERQSLVETGSTAATLRRLARHYRERAEAGHAATGKF